MSAGVVDAKVVATDAGGGMACGCDPRTKPPHRCERHEAERDARVKFDRVDLEVECVNCDAQFELDVFRSDGPSWEVKCPHCDALLIVRRVEYGSARRRES